MIVIQLLVTVTDYVATSHKTTSYVAIEEKISDTGTTRDNQRISKTIGDYIWNYHNKILYHKSLMARDFD